MTIVGRGIYHIGLSSNREGFKAGSVQCKSFVLVQRTEQRWLWAEHAELDRQAVAIAARIVALFTREAGE